MAQTNARTLSFHSTKAAKDKRFTCLFKIEEGNAQKPTYMTTEAQILITIGKKDYG